MYTVDFLRSRRIWFEALLHHPASSSAQRAKSVHVPGRGVAKTVLIKSGDSFLLAVLPSTSWIDMARLSEVLGTRPSEVRLATSDELVAMFTDCEPGVVPPFGRLYELRSVVDSSLAGLDEIVFGANTRHEGLRMRFRDYLAIEEPLMAPFTMPAASKQPIPSQLQPDRRAG